MNKFRLRVQLSEDGRTYEVWYTNNGTNYSLHKGGFSTLDEAVNIMIEKFRYDEVEVDGKIDPKKTEIFATEVYYFNKEIKKYPDDLNIVLVGESGVVKNEQKPDLFDCLIKKSLSTN